MSDKTERPEKIYLCERFYGTLSAASLENQEGRVEYIRADIVRRFENVNDAIFTESELAKQLAEATKEIAQLRADLAKPSEWRDIKTAPKNGTEIVGWFVPNEVDAPEKAQPWVTRWEMKQFKDGTGKKVGKPFGMWVTEGWRDPMSYAPTHWTPRPSPPDKENNGGR